MHKIDTTVVNSLVDCRDLIARDLGEAKVRSSKSVSYACPLHHETKGKSLVVYADGWKCFGKCQRSGDAIGWLMAYHGMTFLEASTALAGDLATIPVKRREQPRRHEPAPAEPPSAEWQERANHVIARAHHVLFYEDAGKPGREYLRSRGIQKHIAQFALLGYIPGDPSHYIESIGMYPGLVIPWEIEGQTWAVNVRRMNNDDGKGKYKFAKGSKLAGSLYGGDFLGYHELPLIFVEGEFDALILWQVASDLVVPLTLGSAGFKLHERWFTKLFRSTTVLIATDSDGAGEAARDRLAALSGRARIMRLPDGSKDVSDLYRDHGREAVRSWLQAAL